jgi:FMN phosphatase YigB (HAD superfamily)
MDTLIEPSQPVANIYRQALAKQCNPTLVARFPPPEHFLEGFLQSIKPMTVTHPCFGATTGMTARQWWIKVVESTYRNTQGLIGDDDDSVFTEEQFNNAFDRAFDYLYNDVFGTSKGWHVKDGAVDLLKALVEWRDGGGVEKGNGYPKLGVISNFDERLKPLLEILDLAQYFDVILGSGTFGSEKPGAEIFHAAVAAVRGCDDDNATSSSANGGTHWHIGDSIDKDVAGARNANFIPIRISVVVSGGGSDDITNKNKLLLGRIELASGLEWYEIENLNGVVQLLALPLQSK